MYTQTHTHTHIHTRTPHAHTHICVCVCVCVRACCVCVFDNDHDTHTHTHTHTCMNVCVCVCVRVVCVCLTTIMNIVCSSSVLTRALGFVATDDGLCEAVVLVEGDHGLQQRHDSCAHHKNAPRDRKRNTPRNAPSHTQTTQSTRPGTVQQGLGGESASKSLVPTNVLNGMPSSSPMSPNCSMQQRRHPHVLMAMASSPRWEAPRMQQAYAAPTALAVPHVYYARHPASPPPFHRPAVPTHAAPPT